MGAQRKIETPEMLEKHINDFIAKCEETGEIPSDYALCKFLSISPTTLECYMTEMLFTAKTCARYCALRPAKTQSNCGNRNRTL